MSRPTEAAAPHPLTDGGRPGDHALQGPGRPPAGPSVEECGAGHLAAGPLQTPGAPPGEAQPVQPPGVLTGQSPWTVHTAVFLTQSSPSSPTVRAVSPREFSRVSPGLGLSSPIKQTPEMLGARKRVSRVPGTPPSRAGLTAVQPWGPRDPRSRGQPHSPWASVRGWVCGQGQQADAAPVAAVFSVRQMVHVTSALLNVRCFISRNRNERDVDASGPSCPPPPASHPAGLCTVRAGRPWTPIQAVCVAAAQEGQRQPRGAVGPVLRTSPAQGGRPAPPPFQSASCPLVCAPR